MEPKTARSPVSFGTNFHCVCHKHGFHHHQGKHRWGFWRFFARTHWFPMLKTSSWWSIRWGYLTNFYLVVQRKHFFPVLWHLALLSGQTFAILLMCSSKPNRPPRYQPLLAGIGFVVSIVWIYVVANEIVSLLKVSWARGYSSNDKYCKDMPVDTSCPELSRS